MSVDMQQLAAELAPLLAKPTPPLLDGEQAGELLNVPSTWVLAQARANRIPHLKLGHYTRFHRDELLAWVERRQTGPTSNTTKGRPHE